MNEVKHCERCGAANPADAAFCEACGVPFARAPAPPYVPPAQSGYGPYGGQPQGGGRSRYMMYAAVGVVALLLVAGLVVAWPKPTNPTPTPYPTTYPTGASPSPTGSTPSQSSGSDASSQIDAYYQNQGMTIDTPCTREVNGTTGQVVYEVSYENTKEGMFYDTTLFPMDSSRVSHEINSLISYLESKGYKQQSQSTSTRWVGYNGKYVITVENGIRALGGQSGIDWTTSAQASQAGESAQLPLANTAPVASLG